MLPRRLFVLLLVVAFPAQVVCSAAFRTKRLIEFHLAEAEPAKGLMPVHVMGEARLVYLHARVEIDDRDIQSAAVVKGPLGEPAVQVHLRPTGVRKLTAVTRKYQRKILAIVSSDRVVSAPVIMGEMVDDLLDIIGSFTPEQAAQLAEMLNSAAGK